MFKTIVDIANPHVRVIIQKFLNQIAKQLIVPIDTTRPIHLFSMIFHQQYELIIIAFYWL